MSLQQAKENVYILATLTECSEVSDPVWYFNDWSLELNQVTKQISCDVYLKKLAYKGLFERYKNEFEEAEERFLIMTAEPDVDDIKACKSLQKKYGRETAVKLWEKYCK